MKSFRHYLPTLANLPNILGPWTGNAGPVVPAINGTPISLVQAVEGDTLDDVVTYGVMTANVGTLNPVVREMKLNAGSWAAYLGSTAMVFNDVWTVRETWTSSGPANRTDTSGPMTVVGEPAATMPTVRSRSIGASASALSATHTMVNPTGATTGDLVVFVTAITTLTTAILTGSTSGWTVETSGDVIVSWKVLTGTNDTQVFTTDSTRQSAFLGWCFSKFSTPVLISSIDTLVGTVAPDSASLAFGGTKSCLVLTSAAYQQSSGIQTAAPSGYSEFRNQNSNTSGSSSRRVCAAEKEVTSTYEDPPAWGVNAVTPCCVTVAVKG